VKGVGVPGWDRRPAFRYNYLSSARRIRLNPDFIPCTVAKVLFVSPEEL